jgi:hypothetical protein
MQLLSLPAITSQTLWMMEFSSVIQRVCAFSSLVSQPIIAIIIELALHLDILLTNPTSPIHPKKSDWAF